MGAVDAIEQACVLNAYNAFNEMSGHRIQDDWLNKAMNLHQILRELEHSSTETIQMIQEALAMGNWWLAASSRQRACSCTTSHAEFFGETSNHPGDPDPLQPRCGALWLLAFPNTQISSERDQWRVLSGFIGCDNLWNLHYFWLPWPVLKGPIQVICRMF